MRLYYDSRYFCLFCLFIIILFFWKIGCNQKNILHFDTIRNTRGTRYFRSIYCGKNHCFRLLQHIKYAPLADKMNEECLRMSHIDEPLLCRLLLYVTPKCWRNIIVLRCILQCNRRIGTFVLLLC